MLIRRCVYENINKDEIHKLFPAEVLPKMQRLLTLLLQKFHSEWQEDIQKEWGTLPKFKTMSWRVTVWISIYHHARVFSGVVSSHRMRLNILLTVKISLPQNLLNLQA